MKRRHLDTFNPAAALVWLSPLAFWTAVIAWVVA